MKCQILISRKNKKNIISLVSAESAHRVVSVKNGPQKCCIQTKMYRLYRKVTIYGHFSVQSIHLYLDAIWLFS